MHRKPQISLQLLGMFPHSTSQLRLLQLCHTARERETVLLAVFQAKQCQLTAGNNPLDELIYFAFLSPTFGLNPFGLKIGVFLRKRRQFHLQFQLQGVVKTIFTVLHGMPEQTSYEKAVRLSVKRVDCDKTEERSVQIFILYERSFTRKFGGY